ncbi:AAA family ATPase [Ruegeria arenilitoris]|uniref:AAA family ATPase n=1 Tax=Ruegeria arenilitoris TaxID=1173585 RepID=UPI00147F92EF|nr:AAA family ATPase [Ruegeria arenilitoris]
MPDLPKNMEEVKIEPLKPEGTAYVQKPLELWNSRKPPKLGFLGTWRGGIYTLTAPTGTGKTAFALVLALSVAAGQDLLNIGIDKPGKVMLCLGENPDETLEKLWCAALSYGVPLEEVEDNLHIVQGVYKPEAIANAMRQYGGGFDLLIIDTLSVFMGLTEGMELNSNSDVLGFLNACRVEFRKDGNPTVFMPAHPTKGATEKGKMIPFGAGSILNQIDGNFCFTSSGNDRVVLSKVGKLRGTFRHDLYFKLEYAKHDSLRDDDGQKLELPVMKPDQRGPTKRQVEMLKYLVGKRLGHNQAARELSEVCECSESTAGRELKYMKDQEWIEQEKSGQFRQYRVSSAGSEWLD